jgi:hypothetical protein
MRKLFLTGLMVVGFAAPAFADDTATMCHLLSDQRRAGGDAAIGTSYEPGATAKGQSAMDAAYTGSADIVQIPLTADLAHRLGVPGGVETAGKVSVLAIHKDGRVMFSDQDLSAQADGICGLPPSVAALRVPAPAITSTTSTTTTTTATTAAAAPVLPPPPVVPVPGVTEPVPGAMASPTQQLQDAGVQPAPAAAYDPTASMPDAAAPTAPGMDSGAAPDPSTYMPKAGSVSTSSSEMDDGAATTYTTTTTHTDSKPEDEGVSKRDDVVWGQQGGQ